MRERKDRHEVPMKDKAKEVAWQESRGRSLTLAFKLAYEEKYNREA